MKCLSIIITVMLFMTVIGENAVFNSGFELGIDGFELNWLRATYREQRRKNGSIRCGCDEFVPHGFRLCSPNCYLS